MSSAIDLLAARLLAHRYRCATELELQDGIEQVLRASEHRYEREARLGPVDRVDFLVERGPGVHLAVELKIKGGHTDVLRQLHRYAQHESVAEVWLVTTRAQHRGMPETLVNKRVRVLYLAGSVL